MEIETKTFDPNQYLVTKPGNKISNKSILRGSQRIILSGKSIIKENTMIRGDLATTSFGKFCIIEKDCVIKPPYRRFQNQVVFYQLSIGNFNIIGENSVISSASIGNFVEIGKNCIIERGCILKDCCKILDGTILPAETVVAPYQIYGGKPGKLIGSLPESRLEYFQDYCIELYNSFIPKKK
ncbi:dynactin subunit 5 [Anaeramoeba flamelloides]|uniref:Dynactin subunit 5 n=1 Tax=Anaeramoeba flamelloides TaxID=1746091 RepID=A0AAV7Y564_9EUKA|nr:dynactin subunit [Anaeramoeba flamelloides]KAJ6235360.1 dynactin subunit 5 [Anaeramoeba flamelloides]